MHTFSGDWPPRPVLPGEYAAWDAALALLNRDLAATLPEHGQLRLMALPPYAEGEPESVYVALADGRWHGNCLPAPVPGAPGGAVADIADAAQETVVECLWQAWPLCAEHGIGMHPRDSTGPLSWWCAGERGLPGTAHLRAAVGELDTLVRPHRPRRKRRRQK
ncbi:hypothetical protein [Streptomyces sp. NPDC055287]